MDVCCISEFFRVVFYIAIAHAHCLPSHFFYDFTQYLFADTESDCNCFLHTISFLQLCFKNFIWFCVTSSLNMLTLKNLKIPQKLKTCLTLIFAICCDMLYCWLEQYFSTVCILTYSTTIVWDI